MQAPFSWPLNSMGKGRHSAYIQIKVSKARPVCERFFKTEQRDVRKEGGIITAKVRQECERMVSVKQGHDLNSKWRTEINSPEWE